MDLPEEAKRAPSAPFWNQSFPSPSFPSPSYATMMIKGSLLLSIPIVKHFQAKKLLILSQILMVFGNR